MTQVVTGGALKLEDNYCVLIHLTLQALRERLCTNQIHSFCFGLVNLPLLELETSGGGMPYPLQ